MGDADNLVGNFVDLGPLGGNFVGKEGSAVVSWPVVSGGPGEVHGRLQLCFSASHLITLLKIWLSLLSAIFCP